MQKAAKMQRSRVSRMVELPVAMLECPSEEESFLERR